MTPPLPSFRLHCRDLWRGERCAAHRGHHAPVRPRVRYPPTYVPLLEGWSAGRRQWSPKISAKTRNASARASTSPCANWSSPLRRARTLKPRRSV